MTDSFLFTRACFDLLWQTSLSLSVGLVAAWLYRRRPARAHLVLVLAGMAAVVAPAATAMVRQQNWGMLPATATLAAVPTRGPAQAESIPSPVPPIADPARSPNSDTKQGPGAALDQSLTLEPNMVDPAPTVELAKAEPGTISRGLPSTTPNKSLGSTSLIQRIPWGWLLLAAWCAGSSILAIRLMASYFTARRWLRESATVDEPRLARLIVEVTGRLGRSLQLDVRRSPCCACPMIWCWRRRPVLLLPAGDRRLALDDELAGVVAHELAHWFRRDHLTSFLAQIACCLLPWQPLLWRLRGRMSELAEAACDDWAITAGCSAADYAEALLRLAPQPYPTMALAVVGSKNGLVVRIQRILETIPREQRPSRRFRVVAAVAMVGLVAMLASLQASENPIAKEGAKLLKRNGAKPGTVVSAAAPQPASSADDSTTATRHVSGTVKDAADKPVAGATVHLLAKQLYNHFLYSRFHDVDLLPAVVGKSETDAEGRYVFDVPVPAGAQQIGVTVRAEGYGFIARWLACQPRVENVNMTVGPPMKLAGRVLDPNGEPVAEAEVVVNYLHRRTGDDSSWFELGNGMYVPPELPEYWPPSARTDSDGRFSIPGLSEHLSVSLRVMADDYPVQAVFVQGRLAEEKRQKEIPYGAFSSLPAEDFTVVLEPKRLIEGRTIDSVTKAPVPHVKFRLQAMSQDQRAGSSTELLGESDDDGRFRMLVPSARLYYVSAHPPLGHISSSGNIDGKEMAAHFAASDTYDRDFAVTPGRVLSGQVLDAETKAPLSGVCVQYHPSKNNPNGRNTDNHYQSAVADSDGRFVTTVLPGQGQLLVMGAPEGYIQRKWPDAIGPRPDGPPLFALQDIDVSVDGELQPVEVPCRRGKTIEFLAIAPNGDPAKKVRAYSSNLFDSSSGSALNMGVDAGKQPIVMHGCDPEQTYRVFIFSQDCHAGAVAEVAYDGTRTEPLRVELQPCGTVKGRLVYRDDVPAKGIQIFTAFLREKSEASKIYTGNEYDLPYYGNFTGGRNGPTNDEGEFEVGDIIPGVQVILRLNDTFATGRSTRPLPIVKPGETIDVGQIEMRR